MVHRISMLVTCLFCLTLLNGCSGIVKLGAAAAKGGAKAAVKGGGAVAKGSTAVKGAGAAVATHAADDVARVAAGVGDDVFRLGAAGADNAAVLGRTADDLTLVLDDAAKVGDEVGLAAKESKLSQAAKEAGSEIAQELIQNADFQEWVSESEAEPGHTSGQGAPPEVGEAFLEALYPADALGRANKVGERYWVQWYRLEHGDRLAVYDTQAKSVLLLRPQPRS